MIEFMDVAFAHAGGPTVFAGFTLALEPGQLVLVAGGTGSGKSTLLATINGLAPHFTGGTLTGEVRVHGRSTREVPPRDMADLVGYVGQNPAHGFVTSRVESELAFAMEQRGVDPAAMRRRVEETLDLVGIADLRDRALDTLSLGQQQRVALGAVLTAGPRVLVLDEPTSALDPVGAEEVLATITRLVDDLGLTVVIAEHRLERVVHYADTVLHLPGDGTVVSGAPGVVLLGTPVAPPLMRLGQLLGWDPVPLTVREARRRARGPGGPLSATVSAVRDAPAGGALVLGARTSAAAPTSGTGHCVLRATGVRVRYGAREAVRGVDLELVAGEVTAVMGRNGSGKSSLLWALQGSGRRDGGTVDVRGADPATASRTLARTLVALVPQDVTSLLFCESVGEECAATDREAGLAHGATSTALDAMVAGIDRDTHPRDLSEGQRLALALVVMLAVPAAVLLLDEPTRGLDYAAKDALVAILRRLADAGTAIAVATHDVELAAVLVDRVVLMAEGEIVADGPARAMLTGSPAFAPQIAKVFAPSTWMTLRDVDASAVPEGAP
ncbi:energy-coupling factor transport system ATP-binding protein [Sanguibacter gelidistatuariae]|uniref:Energy-coupling factor transport system ATP-binding protein n=1 Tax=Sanguibacter gelidistatuariae TaxID=1814289 RepID=A0A1G6RGP6_9MICO|nr:ATP-binding cassette domain-containing protein [Sanguibacter gelidistatuariae]SDD03177.1 energy-coupling factor transport system ATP-binding protein [Sanguibacter gelidistatuariae]